MILCDKYNPTGKWKFASLIIFDVVTSMRIPLFLPEVRKVLLQESSALADINAIFLYGVVYFFCRGGGDKVFKS